ncbi:hypothetical protein [Desulfolithobacter sp.]
MKQLISDQTSHWLSVSALVLREPLENLQPLVLRIGRKNTAMGLYATDLARLRMSGMDMETILHRIWQAETPVLVQEVLNTEKLRSHPSARAICFLADLVKSDTGATIRNRLSQRTETVSSGGSTLH